MCKLILWEPLSSSRAAWDKSESFLWHLPLCCCSQGSRQCSVMSAGFRWWRRCGAPNSLHLDPSLLLWERHQHPACEQHEAAGRDTGRSETWRGAHGPALCSSYCKSHYSRLLTSTLLHIAHFPRELFASWLSQSIFKSQSHCQLMYEAAAVPTVWFTSVWFAQFSN